MMLLILIVSIVYVECVCIFGQYVRIAMYVSFGRMFAAGVCGLFRMSSGGLLTRNGSVNWRS